MFVYVLNRDGTPLMPCRPAKARKLLRGGKAKVVRRTPFTIRLLWDCEGHTQEVVAGMDTGSVKLGCAAVTNGKVVYAAEVKIRNNISRKMKKRKQYRQKRRHRKTRYRPARFLNRATSRRKGRLAPSIRSKLDSHLRERRFVEQILPVTSWIVETAQFDIHQIQNPDVEGAGYQQGQQVGFENVKAYVLWRDDYKCQHKTRGTKHSKKLHVHHIIHRSQGGTDEPNNLITLCCSCHDALHAGEWELPKRRRRSRTRHATHVGIVQSQLKKEWNFTETFGYLTKMKRRQLGLNKTHANDAVAICCAGVDKISVRSVVLCKRHVASGDYRQTKGKRSEIRIPTGKLFGLRRFDFIRTRKGLGFVKGKRSNGCFDMSNVDLISSYSVSVRTNCVRVSARSSTLVQTKC